MAPAGLPARRCCAPHPACWILARASAARPPWRPDFFPASSFFALVPEKGETNGPEAPSSVRPDAVAGFRGSSALDQQSRSLGTGRMDGLSRQLQFPAPLAAKTGNPRQRPSVAGEVGLSRLRVA